MNVFMILHKIVSCGGRMFFIPKTQFAARQTKKHSGKYTAIHFPEPLQSYSSNLRCSKKNK